MKKNTGCLFLVFVLFLTGFMIINPGLAIKASLDGLDLWFRVVLPALLPFFVVSEMLVQLGLVHFLGVLLEPVMRPLFRLPGVSAFVVVMGYTSGFPIGAILTRKLYAEKLLDENEAERLVSFTNNASPLFILGAVAVGMFALPSAGYLLACAHYLANLSVGFLAGRLAPLRYASVSATCNVNPLKAAVARLLEVNRQNCRGIGGMLGESIRNSVNNILTVGGFIIVFSVITQMLRTWGLIDLMAHTIQQARLIPGMSHSLACGLSTGFLEMTLGARTIAASEASLHYQLVATSVVLAWSGLSIIAQVMSIVAEIPVRLSFYVLSRSVQMLLAALYTILGYRFFLHRYLADTISLYGHAAIVPHAAPFSTVGLCIVPLLVSLSGVMLLALTAVVLAKLRC